MSTLIRIINVLIFQNLSLEDSRKIVMMAAIVIKREELNLDCIANLVDTDFNSKLRRLQAYSVSRHQLEVISGFHH